MRISDSALVDAAVLSDRYIADRFLPDKAIDLVSHTTPLHASPAYLVCKNVQHKKASELQF